VSAPLLSVRNLGIEFGRRDAPVRAVSNVSFDIAPGASLGIVGESGSGKSTTSLSILRLLPESATRITSGEVFFEGIDLFKLPRDRMPEIRGRDIAMIFQEPMTALNPVMTIGSQIAEAVLLHEGLDHRRRHARAVEMLRLVGIPAPAERAEAFPHQLSGGMRQRAMIAMALACNPKLLIADEPTTALDVTIQAQVLDLMRRIRERLNTAILIISHDLGVIAEIADHVLVMYAGRVVESADVRSLFRAPAHPYTRGLLRSMPRLNDDRRRLHQIPGSVPSAGRAISGCPFVDRCPERMAICTEQMPPMTARGVHHDVACWIENTVDKALTVPA
jgi:peptide/nickel transport system ATP-binding protein